MSEILKEYDKGQKKLLKIKYSFSTFLRYLGAIVFVIVLAIYVGNTLFGKRSLDVMLSLVEKKEHLSEDVEFLKKQNARLLKEYFELKQLEPEPSKK